MPWDLIGGWLVSLRLALCFVLSLIFRSDPKLTMEGDSHVNGHHGVLPIDAGWEHDSRLEPITSWDPAQCDTIRDRARELLENEDQGFEQFIIALAEEVYDAQRTAFAAWVIHEILPCRRPKLRLVQIALAAGVAEVSERTYEQWGKRFGITKQAVQLGVAQIRKRLNLRKTRNMRSDEGRRNMSKAARQRA